MKSNNGELKKNQHSEEGKQAKLNDLSLMLKLHNEVSSEWKQAADGDRMNVGWFSMPSPSVQCDKTSE